MSILSKLSGQDDNQAKADRFARLEQLAAQVTHGLRNFAAAGDALAEIRDKQLFRCTHATFETFCQERWRMTPQHAGRLIEAATIARNLEPTGSTPATERQARELAKLPPTQQRDAWTEATAAGPATAKTVQRAVAKRLPSRRRKPKPIRVRVPRAIVIIERRSADVDPIAALQQAIEKLRSERVTDAAA